MFKDINYLFPSCTTSEVFNGGILCASVGQVDGNDTEKFDNWDDFEW